MESGRYKFSADEKLKKIKHHTKWDPIFTSSAAGRVEENCTKVFVRYMSTKPLLTDHMEKIENRNMSYMRSRFVGDV